MIPKRQIFALAKGLEGVPVLGALAGSAAARAGLRYGDVLLSVNGMRTRNVAEYIEAKSLRADGMTVVVFRGDGESSHELTYESRSPTDVTKILAELVTLRIGLEDEGPDPTGSA
jgi:S1-C subfamily serine protease